MGSRILSLFLQLPSSGPGGLQPVPCRDLGTEGIASLWDQPCSVSLRLKLGWRERRCPQSWERSLLGRVASFLWLAVSWACALIASRTLPYSLLSAQFLGREYQL